LRRAAIACLFLLGTLLASACEVREIEATFRGYRVLKDGTKLVLVSDYGHRYCPLSAVRLTPSVEVGDIVTITNLRACGGTLDKFEEGGPPNELSSGDSDTTSH
jgi:hypothetical protein